MLKKLKKTTQTVLYMIICHHKRNRSWKSEYDSRCVGIIGDIEANEAVNKSFIRIFTFTRSEEHNSSDVRTDMK